MGVNGMFYFHIFKAKNYDNNNVTKLLIREINLIKKTFLLQIIKKFTASYKYSLHL